jgi:hypothetical protein
VPPVTSGPAHCRRGVMRDVWQCNVAVEAVSSERGNEGRGDRRSVAKSSFILLNALPAIDITVRPVPSIRYLHRPGSIGVSKKTPGEVARGISTG